MQITLDKKNKLESCLLEIQRLIRGTYWEGHVYAVGGCVRDKLLGTPIHDIDLVIDVEHGGVVFAEWVTRTTSCYSSGSNPVIFPTYGTAKFQFRNSKEFSDVEVECVHTRKEQYKDPNSRNPTQVFGTIKEDAQRRDLTINALYLNLSTLEVVDPTGMGLSDLQNKVIRTTDAPSIIFNDDPLRLLRVIRFASRLKWGITKGTWFGIVENAHRISIVSKERINDELTKILLCDTPSLGIERLKNSGLLKLILPDIYAMIGVTQGPQHFGDVYEHTLAVVDGVRPTMIARWAALLHDCGKPATRVIEKGIPRFFGHEKKSEEIATKVLWGLKFSNENILKITSIVKNHMRFKQFGDVCPPKKSIRKLIVNVGGDCLRDALEVIHADNTSHSAEYLMVNQIPLVYEQLEEMMKEESLTAKVSTPINGKEIMQLFSLPQGQRIGKIKKHVEEWCLEDPSITKEECIARIGELIGKGEV